MPVKIALRGAARMVMPEAVVKQRVRLEKRCLEHLDNRLSVHPSDPVARPCGVMVSNLTKKFNGFPFSGQVRWRRAPLASPAPHCERPPPPHPPRPSAFVRGAPGAEGDRSRIRWTPTGAPDGHPQPIIAAAVPCTACTAYLHPLPAQDLQTTRERCVPDGAHDSVRT